MTVASTRRAGETPTMPEAPVSTAAARVVQLALREDCSVEELGAVAASDPALSLKLLGLVNSAALRVRQQITDVPRAAAVLGLRGMRNVALSLVVAEMVPPGPDGDALLANCLRRAIAARELAERLRDPDPMGHFTTGLLLDVGLLLRARDDITGAGHLARVPAAHRVLQERAAGGDPHPAAGAALGRQFGLPSPSLEAIEAHHAGSPPASPVARLAWAAERVAACFEGGQPDRLVDEAIAAAAALGLSRDDAEAAVTAVPAAVELAAQGFDRHLGPQVELAALVDDATRGLIALNEQYEGLVRTLEAVLDEKERLMVELQRANVQLTELASTDPLTGLPNKRALRNALERDLARSIRDGNPLSLVVADVDHFKGVNDTYGHATGDEVLRVVAERLRAGIRGGDAPARYGGEEFVVLLPGAAAEGARVVAERLRSDIAATEVSGPEGPIRVTVSFGVAAARTGDTPELLFARADAALYEAKVGGRNRVAVAAPS